MVRQTKRFKKGLNKKVLSAILAASMIMTSSSFAFAAPLTDDSSNNENQSVAVAAQSLGDADVLEDNNSVDAQVAIDKEHDSDLVSLEGEDVEAGEIKNQTYANGAAIKPDVVVKYDETTLTKDKDYEIKYSNNKDSKAVSGEDAKVTIKFINDYDDLDPIEKTFTIEQFPLTTENVVVDYAAQDAYTYTGEEVYPAVNSVKVKMGDKEVTLDADDYDVTATGITEGKGGIVNVNTGLQVQITGKGNYKGWGGVSQEYAILPADIAEGASVTVAPTVFNATDTTESLAVGVANNVTVVDNGTGEELKDNDDYTIAWYDEKTGEYKIGDYSVASFDIGTHKIRIYGLNDDNLVGEGNFSKDSYIETTYEIVKSSSLQMTVDAALPNSNIGDFKYDAELGALTVPYTGKDNYVEAEDVVLNGVSTKEYTVKVADGEWINAGDYAIVIEGKNTYAGETVTIPVKVTPRNLNTKEDVLAPGIEVNATQGQSTAGGTGDLIVAVTDKNLFDETGKTSDPVVLEEGKDYTYTTKTEDDQLYVVITGIGNYTTKTSDEDVTTLVYKVTVDKKRINLADSSITAKVNGTYKYNGSQHKPSINDVELIGADGKAIPKDQLQITWGENISAGEGTVTVTVKDKNNKKYYGSRTIAFEIEGEDFSNVFELAEIKDFDKDNVSKKGILDAIKVVYKDGGATYAIASGRNAERIDVEITKDGKEVDLDNEEIVGGVYDVTVTPTDVNPSAGYVGEITGTFNVIGNDLKESGAKIADIADVVYTSEAIEPDVVVTVGNKTLEEGKDYTVAYSDNVKGGEATVTVTGINDYSGTLEKNFKITRAAQAITMSNPLQERDLGNGSRTSTSKVCTLKLATTMADEDTKYTYTTSDPSVATVNAGKITYQGVGECTITVSAAATDSCEAASLDIKVVVGKPGTPTFTPSVTKNTGKKAFVVTSSTVKGVDGWEVQYSIRDDFWKATTKDFAGTKTKLLRQTCKTVHSNMTYYVRVRGYQTVDGEKVYSDWSPVKTIKTK